MSGADNDASIEVDSDAIAAGLRVTYAFARDRAVLDADNVLAEIARGVAEVWIVNDGGHNMSIAVRAVGGPLYAVHASGHVEMLRGDHAPARVDPTRYTGPLRGALAFLEKHPPDSEPVLRIAEALRFAVQ